MSHLARCRVLAGHSQRSLAEAAGISKRGLQELEAGHHKPRLTTATALARALGVADARALFPELLGEETSS